MKESYADAPMERVARILEDSLTASRIDQWLRSRNRTLGGRRPVELIDERDAAKVHKAA